MHNRCSRDLKRKRDLEVRKVLRAASVKIEVASGVPNGGQVHTCQHESSGLQQRLLLKAAANVTRVENLLFSNEDACRKISNHWLPEVVLFGLSLEAGQIDTVKVGRVPKGHLTHLLLVERVVRKWAHVDCAVAREH